MNDVIPQPEPHTFKPGDKIRLDLSFWPYDEDGYLQEVCRQMICNGYDLDREALEEEPEARRVLHNMRGVVTAVAIDNGGADRDYVDVEVWGGGFLPAISAMHLVLRG